MRVRLPIPANWQDFEMLCHQLWKEVWCDQNAQRNGRYGQAQAGVDIYGHPIYGANYSGVQCKDKDRRLGSKLTERQLRAECSNAQTFTPQLREFTLATTAPSDVAIQAVARNINSSGCFPFHVHVWSWDEIEAEIASRPTLVNTFYSSAPRMSSSPSVKISVSAPRDQFFAFFSRPHLISEVGASLKDSLAQVSYELCDNAFSHGKARHVELTFEGTKLEIRDDGAPFNPLAQLDGKQVSVRGYVGSYVLEAFRSTYGADVECSHSSEVQDGVRRNVFTIDICNGKKYLGTPEVLDVSINLSSMFGRRGADGLAESIVVPTGTKEVVITVANLFNMSGSVHFIDCLRRRLPPSVLLVVSHPRNALIGELSHLFGDSVKFQPR